MTSSRAISRPRCLKLRQHVERPPMPPIALNRRRFLGCSAAAGLALSQGRVVEAAGAADLASVRLGVIGLGTRGTSLLRSLLELPGVKISAVCDLEPKHRQRGQGVVE